MRNQYNGFSGAGFFQRFKDDAFVQSIQITGRLIEEEERRIVQKCAGKSDTLLFSARKGIPKLPDRRMIAIRKGYYKVVNGGFFCRSDNRFLRRI